MATGGRIRDPVHGYIRFTRVERRLIDDPVVQRLRYIGQAGLSHLVFPEVRTSGQVAGDVAARLQQVGRSPGARREP